MPLAQARANKLQTEWSSYRPPRPALSGVQAIDDVTVAGLRTHIDWGPFFRTWELKGAFPALLDHPQRGAEARELYDNASAMLDRSMTAILDRECMGMDAPKVLA